MTDPADLIAPRHPRPGVLMTTTLTAPRPETTIERARRVRALVADGHAARLLPDARDPRRPVRRESDQARFNRIGLPRGTRTFA